MLGLAFKRLLEEAAGSHFGGWSWRQQASSLDAGVGRLGARVTGSACCTAAHEELLERDGLGVRLLAVNDHPSRQQSTLVVLLTHTEELRFGVILRDTSCQGTSALPHDVPLGTHLP